MDVSEGKSERKGCFIILELLDQWTKLKKSFGSRSPWHVWAICFVKERRQATPQKYKGAIANISGEKNGDCLNEPSPIRLQTK